MKTFDKSHVLHQLMHYLPSQTPIKDFIHHNTLHAFQHMKFYDAIFKASKIFGYQVTLQLQDFRKMFETGRIKENILDRIIAGRKGAANVEEWKKKLLSKSYDTHNEYRIGSLRKEWNDAWSLNPDETIHPLLFRILAGYLDQGISIWKFPADKKGFLNSIRELEKNNIVSFFKTKRARKLLTEGEISIESLLKIIVGDPALYEQYLFDQQFSHPGWSGMVASVEAAPHTLLDARPVTLEDIIIFELLMEVDLLEQRFGNSWRSLSEEVTLPVTDLFEDVKLTELNEVFIMWQDTFEWSYYDEVLAGIINSKKKGATTKSSKTFQAIFCIDERECSLRRHLESTDLNCETLGSPGFFGVEFYFQPDGGKFYEKLCPAPVTPKYLIKETDVKEERKHELLYTPHAQTLLSGTLSSVTLGFVAAGRMMQNLFRPKMSPAISNAFAHMNKHSQLSIENKDVNARENDLQIGFTIAEMTARVEGLLRGIGLIKNFAPIVYAVAHGSSSANNPHHSAHDCGACSGRPGSVNARVFAFMANHPLVRKSLSERGIIIPSSTLFIGSMHDTAADQINFYDDELIAADFRNRHLENIKVFEQALDLNAKERSRRFASIKTKNKLRKVRQDILDRSVSMFEPRPELGHGTNALCIVGRRDITKGLFLDRRAFLNSYDPTTDPEGNLLVNVMKPIGLVCGGINLEYYFSRVDNYRFGAGTKLPHNVMGLIGVANSSDGDLRPGLPLQMIEVHDPVRLLVIVEHYPEVVLKTIQAAPEMFEWYKNEWVHIAALHPETNEIYYFKDGRFSRYEPLTKELSKIRDMKTFVESAKELETNYIVDATRENLPVHELN